MKCLKILDDKRSISKDTLSLMMRLILSIDNSTNPLIPHLDPSALRLCAMRFGRLMKEISKEGRCVWMGREDGWMDQREHEMSSIDTMRSGTILLHYHMVHYTASSLYLCILTRKVPLLQIPTVASLINTSSSSQDSFSQLRLANFIIHQRVSFKIFSSYLFSDFSTPLAPIL